MSPETTEYLSRAKREYVSSEPVGIAKPFFEISPYIFGENKSNIFLSLYWYARLIDNGVDSGTNPLQMKRIIRHDMQRLKHSLDTADFQSLTRNLIPDPDDDNVDFRMNLLKIGLESVENQKRPIIGHCILESLKGAYLDNISISTARPLPDTLRPYRDKRMIFYYFDALSQVFFDHPVASEKNEKTIEQFFQWCIQYDAIDDIKEDLRSGTFSFTRKDMKSAGVSLVHGKNVPSEFENLYRAQKKKLISDSKTELPKIFLSNLPFIAKLAIYIRLNIQMFRIRKSTYPVKEQVVFGTNYSIS